MRMPCATIARRLLPALPRRGRRVQAAAFDAVCDWNQAHPVLRLGIAYDNASLPMVERVETPVFYFLDHGTVVDTVVGWPPGGNLDAIRRGLRKIDLLR